MARSIPEPCAAPGGSCRTLSFEYVLETHPKFLIKGVAVVRLCYDWCVTPSVKMEGFLVGCL